VLFNTLKSGTDSFGHWQIGDVTKIYMFMTMVY
jgi:hypothetical protein